MPEGTKVQIGSGLCIVIADRWLFKVQVIGVVYRSYAPQEDLLSGSIIR
jgi:hypothetical protein